MFTCARSHQAEVDKRHQLAGMPGFNEDTTVTLRIAPSRLSKFALPHRYFVTLKASPTALALVIDLPFTDLLEYSFLPDIESPTFSWDFDPDKLGEELEKELTKAHSIPINIQGFFAAETPDIDELILLTVTSLLDPITLRRMKIPVKLLRCYHFECFDYELFCELNNIPRGISGPLLREIRSISSKRLNLIIPASMARYFPTSNARNISQATTVRVGKENFHCPYCNVPFNIYDLYLSELFDYLLRNTSNHIHRVEIYDLTRFREVDDRILVKTLTENEVVEIVDDDDDEVQEVQEAQQVPFRAGLDNSAYKSISWLLDMNMQSRNVGNGEGTADDPVTLD